MDNIEYIENLKLECLKLAINNQILGEDAIFVAALYYNFIVDAPTVTKGAESSNENI